MFVSEPLSTNLPLGKNKPRRGEREPFLSGLPDLPPSVVFFHTPLHEGSGCVDSGSFGVLIKSLMENLRDVRSSVCLDLDEFKVPERGLVMLCQSSYTVKYLTALGVLNFGLT